MLKQQTIDHMKDLQKARKEDEAAFDDHAGKVIDDYLERSFSHAYRDAAGGAARRNRGTHSLPAKYLPSIINGKRVYD